MATANIERLKKGALSLAVDGIVLGTSKHEKGWFFFIFLSGRRYRGETRGSYSPLTDAATAPWEQG